MPFGWKKREETTTTMADPVASLAISQVDEEIFSPGAQEDNNEPTEDAPPANVQESSQSLLASCKDYFDRKEFHYDVEEPGEGRSLIKAGIGGVNGSYKMVVDIKEARKIVIVYVLSSIRFPVAHRHKLCEFLTRANYSLVLGNFELDMNDGEVRYKCSGAVGPEGLSFEVLDQMVPAAMGTMDRYFENMVKVSYGVMEPKPAVEQVENGSSYAAGALREALGLSSSDDSRSASTGGDLSSSSERSQLENMFSQFLASMGNGDGAGDNESAMSQ